MLARAPADGGCGWSRGKMLRPHSDLCTNWFLFSPLVDRMCACQCSLLLRKWAEPDQCLPRDCAWISSVNTTQWMTHTFTQFSFLNFLSYFFLLHDKWKSIMCLFESVSSWHLYRWTLPLLSLASAGWCESMKLMCSSGFTVRNEL